MISTTQDEIIDGLLQWEDDDPNTTIEHKIETAIQRYFDKFNVAPDICKVNIDIDFKPKRVGRVKIIKSKVVQPNNFLVGMKS